MVRAGSHKRRTFTYCTKLHISQIIILISAILGTSNVTYITANFNLHFRTNGKVSTFRQRKLGKEFDDTKASVQLQMEEDGRKGM
jgi:hypothetical protein